MLVIWILIVLFPCFFVFVCLETVFLCATALEHTPYTRLASNSQEIWLSLPPEWIKGTHMHHQASFSLFNIQHVGYRLKWNVWFVLPVVCELVSGVHGCLLQTNTMALWNFPPKPPVSYFTQVSSLVLTISLHCWKETVWCSVEVKFPGEQLPMSSCPSSAARIVTHTDLFFFFFFWTLYAISPVKTSSASSELYLQMDCWVSPPPQHDSPLMLPFGGLQGSS